MLQQVVVIKVVNVMVDCDSFYIYIHLEHGQISWKLHTLSGSKHVMKLVQR